MKTIESEVRTPDRLRSYGFTLVEILVAIVVTSIVAGAMVSLLLGQGRFYGKSDANISMQQNIRAAADLMASEFRMASADDLVAATTDSVSLRVDILRAVVCDSTAADEATLMVLDSLPSVGLSTGVTGTAFSAPYDSAFVYADSWTGTLGTTGTTPKATCTALGSPTTAPDAWYRTVTGWKGNFPSDSVPDQGSFVRQYQLLTYRLAPSVFGSGTALWRGSQELVGPFDSTAFNYVMDDATVQTSVTGTDLANVAAIRFSGKAVDDDSRFDLDRSVEIDMELRN